jgi:hypothetical protein
MDWIQFAIFLSAMAGMFSWLRSDILMQRSESSADRRDILSLIRQIQEEMKDFHGRLCAIEERNKGKNSNE